VVGELDLDCSVVEEFGGSFALDLVAFFTSVPAKADRVAGVFDLENPAGPAARFWKVKNDRYSRCS
jgi:hypothetical protein